MTKGVQLQRIWTDLSDERKQRICKRAEELKADYMLSQDIVVANSSRMHAIPLDGNSINQIDSM